MFTLEFSTGSAAFDDFLLTELTRILEDVVKQLDGYTFSGTIRDINGNAIGSWTLKDS